MVESRPGFTYLAAGKRKSISVEVVIDRPEETVHDEVMFAIVYSRCA